jgi:hypothetical protein
MRAVWWTLLMIMTAAPAAAHSWYRGLYDPEGRACCDEQDCRPVGTCRMRDGARGIFLDGQCIAIPWSRVLDTASPDDRVHACWARIRLVPHPVIRCVIVPSEA